MKRPAIADMPEDLRAAARSIAQRLRADGAQSWLVGGAVRDLALGRTPKDVDLATDATPERVEQLFPQTKGVGRAFGTMLVIEHGVVAQLTTFRSEAGYSDARRPDRVSFGASPEEDAQRRDFTCNALYLDPLEDRLLDPVGGFADLEQRRLACVGNAAERFREDGLRLLRLARFAADLDLEVAPETLAGARQSVASIAGVSGERVLAELATIFTRPRAARALGLLHELGVLALALPGLHAADMPKRCRVAEACGDPLGVREGLALLLLDEVLDPLAPSDPERLEQRLASLKPSSELRGAVRETAGLLREFERWAGTAPARSALVRAVRRESFGTATRLALASRVALGRPNPALAALLARAATLGPAELHPKPWLDSHDLAQSGIPRGPRWKELLTEIETLQLDGQVGSREQALAWLAQRRS